MRVRYVLLFERWKTPEKIWEWMSSAAFLPEVNNLRVSNLFVRAQFLFNMSMPCLRENIKGSSPVFPFLLFFSPFYPKVKDSVCWILLKNIFSLIPSFFFSLGCAFHDAKGCLYCQSLWSFGLSVWPLYGFYHVFLFSSSSSFLMPCGCCSPSFSFFFAPRLFPTWKMAIYTLSDTFLKGGCSVQ